MHRSHFVIPVVVAAAATLVIPAFAQRLGSPTSVQQNPDQQDRSAKSAAPTGPVVDELVIKAGEQKAVILAAEDGATKAHLVQDSAIPRNALSFSLTVKNGVSTLRVSNGSGGVVRFDIEADPDGSGRWASAGEVKDLKNQQRSSTDYQLALAAVRITGLSMTARK